MSLLSDGFAGLCLVDPVCVWFVVRAAQDGLLDGLDWDVGLVLAHSDSSFCVLADSFCACHCSTKSGSCFCSNSKHRVSTSGISSVKPFVRISFIPSGSLNVSKYSTRKLRKLVVFQY